MKEEIREVPDDIIQVGFLTFYFYDIAISFL